MTYQGTSCNILLVCHDFFLCPRYCNTKRQYFSNSIFFYHFSIHRFIPNISDLDIPAHDKRILELLAIKYHKLEEAEEKSHARHLEWQREIHDIAYQRDHRDEEWKNVVMKKRQEENKINSQKLLDSKRKLVQSQNHLRNLMLQKDERREKLHETAKIQKAFNFASWKVTEESRRGAVEEALEQLLARDTQYRKELKGHIENRVEAAKERRAYHRKQYIQVDYKLLALRNNFEFVDPLY